VGQAEDACQGFAKGSRGVAAGVKNAEEGDLLGGEELVDDCSTLRSIGALLGGVQQFDPADDVTGLVFGQDESDVLVRDQVVGRLAAAFRSDFEEVGEADLDRDPADRADERFEDGEEVPFGGSHEVQFFTHEVELPDAAAVVAERQVECEGEQGRPDKETGHQIRTEDNARWGFGHHGRCGKLGRRGNASLGRERGRGGNVIGLLIRIAGEGGTGEQREEREPEKELLHVSGFSPEMKHRGRHVIVRGHETDQRWRNP
jgi:hypothetical protein